MPALLAGVARRRVGIGHQQVDIARLGRHVLRLGLLEAADPDIGPPVEIAGVMDHGGERADGLAVQGRGRQAFIVSWQKAAIVSVLSSRTGTGPISFHAISRSTRAHSTPRGRR